MRKLFLTLIVTLWGWTPLAASPADIEATISDQIAAFQQDDFPRAFTFASPNIQRLFGDSDRFGMMVRQGYPMVWRPADVRFLDLRTIGDMQWQKVQIRDMGGVIHILDYQMINLDNEWRINGVQLLPSPEVGA